MQHGLLGTYKNQRCRCPACREANRIYHLEYRANRREEETKHTQLWRERHPDRARRRYAIDDAARRAHKTNQFIEDIDPAVVYGMHGGRCGICGEFIEDDFHVDHVIPLSKGGMHGYINVQPAHPKCNVAKGASIL